MRTKYENGNKSGTVQPTTLDNLHVSEELNPQDRSVRNGIDMHSIPPSPHVSRNVREYINAGGDSTDSQPYSIGRSGYKSVPVSPYVNRVGQYTNISNVGIGSLPRHPHISEERIEKARIDRAEKEKYMKLQSAAQCDPDSVMPGDLHTKACQLLQQGDIKHAYHLSKATVAYGYTESAGLICDIIERANCEKTHKQAIEINQVYQAIDTWHQQQSQQRLKVDAPVVKAVLAATGHFNDYIIATATTMIVGEPIVYRDKVNKALMDYHFIMWDKKQIATCLFKFIDLDINILQGKYDQWKSKWETANPHYTPVDEYTSFEEFSRYYEKFLLQLKSSKPMVLSFEDYLSETPPAQQKVGRTLPRVYVKGRTTTAAEDTENEGREHNDVTTTTLDDPTHNDHCDHEIETVGCAACTIL